jgi:hypothetical protein
VLAVGAECVEHETDRDHIVCAARHLAQWLTATVTVWEAWRTLEQSRTEAEASRPGASAQDDLPHLAHAGVWPH